MKLNVESSLFTLQEFSTDTPEGSFPDDKKRASASTSRKSSTTPPSPEVYESSPRTERQFYSNPEYIVTSI